jgi:hypothetical protein
MTAAVWPEAYCVTIRRKYENGCHSLSPTNCRASSPVQIYSDLELITFQVIASLDPHNSHARAPYAPNFLMV